MKLRNKNTGEILEDVKYIDTSLTTIEIHYLDNGISRMETEKDYHSFLQNWEDYGPKESPIKEEKIREIILLCANKDETDAYRIASDSAKVHILGYVDTQYLAFSLELYNTPIVDCDSEKLYTITELCGEEG